MRLSLSDITASDTRLNWYVNKKHLCRINAFVCKYSVILSAIIIDHDDFRHITYFQCKFDEYALVFVHFETFFT